MTSSPGKRTIAFVLFLLVSWIYRVDFDSENNLIDRWISYSVRGGQAGGSHPIQLKEFPQWNKHWKFEKSRGDEMYKQILKTFVFESVGFH